MKKRYLALLPTLFLAACSNTHQPLSKDALVGEWVCSTAYKDVGVGMLDVITLKADGTLEDDNYIFDHSLDRFVGKDPENYFRSPLRYFRVHNGTWNLSDNDLTYHLKQTNFKRIIWPDVWEQLQEIDELKQIEAKAFKIYSSTKEADIQLTFNKFIKNGFTLNQNLNGRIYESKCLDKQSSEYRYIEAYKKIHKSK
ncbi:hypothetical protein ACFFHK_08600 [Gallibacterium trehalosifermentans]|uniref:Lipoprotein n=1 Tax=Gallibacterium trehalosifermentans TaxID=516935 RepID=A0ABV6H310_9PAST